MFLKRWQYGKRDHVSIAFTTILPVAMLFAGLLLLKYGEADGNLGGGFSNQGLRPLVLSQCTFTIQLCIRRLIDPTSQNTKQHSGCGF
jgi:hypothetical protein